MDGYQNQVSEILLRRAKADFDPRTGPFLPAAMTLDQLHFLFSFKQS